MLDTRVSSKLLYLTKCPVLVAGNSHADAEGSLQCKQCIQHEGTHVKAPMWSIIVIAMLELLHLDFTSIEMTMGLDQPPNMVQVLVFCDHFMKHVVA